MKLRQIIDLPLFAIGMLALFARAIPEIAAHGDWGFLIIGLSAVALLGLGLWPVRKELAPKDGEPR